MVDKKKTTKNCRLVYGFCSKEDAENILRCIPRSVLLVRFSDIEYAKIKISVKNRNGGMFVVEEKTLGHQLVFEGGWLKTGFLRADSTKIFGFYTKK